MQKKDCSNCYGTGQARQYDNDPDTEAECPTCMGSGTKPKKVWPKLHDFIFDGQELTVESNKKDKDGNPRWLIGVEAVKFARAYRRLRGAEARQATHECENLRKQMVEYGCIVPGDACGDYKHGREVRPYVVSVTVTTVVDTTYVRTVAGDCPEDVKDVVLNTPLSELGEDANLVTVTHLNETDRNILPAALKLNG